MKAIYEVNYRMLMVLALASSVHAEEIGGIEFPQGDVSFADKVVSYTAGNPAPTHVNYLDADEALAEPDHSGVYGASGSVSLGNGGSIVLEFTNNLLTGSGDTAKDLHIFEVGSDVEGTMVEISKDGELWYSVGSVLGAISSIDIDAFGFDISDQFRFVRLTDDPNEGGASGPTVGADIDAVGAISTEAVQDSPPLSMKSASIVQFQTALGSSYTIQESIDLVGWTDLVVDIVGDGDLQEFSFDLIANKKFYRLKPVADER